MRVDLEVRDLLRNGRSEWEERITPSPGVKIKDDLNGER